MGKYKELSHVVYKCDYHLVWTPKYRFGILTGEIKDLVETDIRKLYKWKSCEVLELDVQPDHIHLVVFNATEAFTFINDGYIEGQDCDKII